MKSKKNKKLEQVPSINVKGTMFWSGEILTAKEKEQKLKEEFLNRKYVWSRSSSVEESVPFTVVPYPNTSVPVNRIKHYFAEISPISVTNKKIDNMLPDHIHDEIEVALNIFDPLFLKRYSNRKIENLSWNKHDGLILASLPPMENEIPIIEYKFADQLLKLD